MARINVSIGVTRAREAEEPEGGAGSRGGPGSNLCGTGSTQGCRFFLTRLGAAASNVRGTTRARPCMAIFCAQHQKKDWHARLRGGVHADAIMDRIVHTATWLESGEIAMRAKLSSSVPVTHDVP